jgi:uncharacterized membrane protein
MASTDVILPKEATRGLPTVRGITPADLLDALARGVDDFRAMPTHVIFLSLIYPIAGLAIARWTFGYDLVSMIYPLLAGFALIGPFAAIGLYELSRRREMGLDTACCWWRSSASGWPLPTVSMWRTSARMSGRSAWSSSCAAYSRRPRATT